MNISAEKPDPGMRRSARLAAVQALYQMEIAGTDAETVVEEFSAFRFDREPFLTVLGAPDEEFFAAIVRGVPHHQVEIDAAVAESLAENWRLSRIDSVSTIVRSIHGPP